jgi:hypothetical protein
MAAVTLAAVIGLAAGPVLADNDDWNRGRNDHHGKSYDRDRDSHGGYSGYRAYDYYGSRGYVYAPPAVVYAPYSPPSIDFVFPIHIR